jgi:hypothetical protein
MTRGLCAGVLTLGILLATAPSVLAAGQTVNGTVASVDVARGIVTLKDGTAWHVGPRAVIYSHEPIAIVRPLAIGQVEAGATVTLRGVEPAEPRATPRTDTPGSPGPRPGTN